MQNAIEFITTKKNGRLIEIPEEFINEVTGQFRVILILNQKTTKENKPKSKVKLKALNVELNGYKFNRDDAYNE